MGKRASKPTKFRALEGGRSNSLPKPDKLLEKEPQPRPVAPKPPPKLPKAAKKVWRELAPILERLGLLTETDRDSFAGVCKVMGRLRDIMEETGKADFKMIVDGKINPLLVEERLLHNQLRMYAPEFGLTPRGRVGLTVGADKEDDGADLLS